MDSWNSGPDEIQPAKSSIAVSLNEPVSLKLDGRKHVPVLSIYTKFKQTVDRIPNHIALGEKH
jgi:hypothetical protein